MEPDDDMNPNRFISVHKFWFEFFGHWYTDHSVLSGKFWLNFMHRIWIWLMLTVIPVGGEILYLYRTGDDIAKVAEGLYLMLSEAYMAFKLMNFFYNKKKVLILVDHLKSKEFYATEPEHLHFIKKAIRQSRIVSKGYLYLCLIAISAGCSLPICEKFKVLPTNVEYPYLDALKSPTYQIIYMMQIYSKTAIVLLDGVLDTIMPAFMAQALGQLDVLAFNLENLSMLSKRYYIKKYVKKPNGKFIINDKRLLEIIKMKLHQYLMHHLSIIRYVAKIEDAFSTAAAIQFMLSTMVICLIGIKFLTIDNPMKHPMHFLWTLVYLFSMMSEIFMLCWFGNEIIKKSEYLQQAAFNADMTDYHMDVKKTLIIFFERNKIPLRLTAGKIFILSLDTYANLLKCSYNAFAVLRKMKQ